LAVALGSIDATPAAPPTLEGETKSKSAAVSLFIPSFERIASISSSDRVFLSHDASLSMENVTLSSLVFPSDASSPKKWLSALLS
jgi:hypothetical protein